MKFAAAIIGLLFCVYSATRIASTWDRRGKLNVSFWWVFLSLLGGICIGLLGRWSWIPLLGLLPVSLVILVLAFMNWARRSRLGKPS